MTTPFEISDRLVSELAALHPPMATYWGIDGDHGSWGGVFSVEGAETGAAVGRRYLDELEPHLGHPDPRQRLAARSVAAELRQGIDDFEHGDYLRALRHLGGPLHLLRNVFDVMPSGTPEADDALIRRLEGVPGALTDMRATAAAGQAAGVSVAKRQGVSVAEQARHLSGPDSILAGVVSRVGNTPRAETALAAAKEAAAAFGDWLTDEYVPKAPVRDGVGADHYTRAVSKLVGKDTDPMEAYEWGWAELARLIGEMERIGKEILPGAGWQEVRRHLDEDPAGLVHSPEELVAFARKVLDQAIEDLAETHFDVPEEIRPLTVQVAPPGGAMGVYYIGPSDDLSRPGGVWYAIGDQTTFPLYQHRSTAYHEGFPGHHLQIATSRYLKDSLCQAQRLLVHCVGYTEGWGMYAEILMGELGYLSEPAHYFGMLAKQMYRASRVVVDIGLHLGLDIDRFSEVAAGESWSYENAVAFMEHYGMQNAVEAEAEVLRYLGWPGQAPTYKLGEREILAIREESRAQLGDAFDKRKFHSDVLAKGAVRLDLLREEMLG